ncbi:MAG: tetratricopeptide repeat protein, partial [Waddliaceae bacterium]
METQAGEADRFFEATLYDKAVPLYHELLSYSQTNTEYNARIRLRLAQCYFFTNQCTKIPGLLSGINPTAVNSNPRIRKLNNESIFLLGLSHNKIKQYDQAITSFLSYLSLDEKTSLPFYEDAQYELGVAYFHAKKFPEAKTQFEIFSEKSQKKRFFPLSRIYLARIAIYEERFPNAERILNTIAKQVVSDDILPYAVSFLRGELLFHQKDWSRAATHFEETLPSRNQNKADWYEDTLYYLGWCYLNLGNDPSQTPDNQAHYLDKSETVFRKNLELFPSDRAYLALGQCYLAKSLRLENTKALEELESLFSGKNLFDSREALHQGLLLRAESSRSYSERKKFFRQLTQESNADSPYYANAWYLRGLNELDEVQAHVTANRKSEAKKHVNNAIEALRKAFDLLYPTNKKLAALTLKYQVQAYSYQNNRDGYVKGLALLGKLLNRYRDDLFPLLEEPDEVYYLQGLNASNLIDKEEGKVFFDIAINSLTHAVESYPNGKYYDESLNLLGTLYYRQGDFEKAEQTYFELTKSTPKSPFVGEALFWMANCIDNLGDDTSRSKLYRRQVFEQYPHTLFADEAYFRYYNYQEYLRGNH